MHINQGIVVYMCGGLCEEKTCNILKVYLYIFLFFMLFFITVFLANLCTLHLSTGI